MKCFLVALLLSSAPFRLVLSSDDKIGYVVECQIKNLNKELLSCIAQQTTASCKCDLSTEDLINNAIEKLNQGELKEALIRHLGVDASSSEIEEVHRLASNKLYQKYAKNLNTFQLELLGKVQMNILDLAAESVKGGNVINLDKGNLQETIDKFEYLVLDIYSDWCPPCKMLSPVLEQLSKEFLNDYKFAKVNAEKESDLIDSLKIKSFPTLIFFKNGKEVARHSGFLDRDNLVEKMQQSFN